MGVLGDACLEHERIALLPLKPFFNHYNELANCDEAKGSNCCEWVGIECNTTTKRLIGLSLHSTRYEDEGWYLNASMFLSFVEFKSLNLQGNSIVGCIENEDEMHLRLTELEQLDLSNNLFRNNTFSFLKGLSSLKSLTMVVNNLQGSLDIKGLEISRNLTVLDLSENWIESLES
ncbi:hypothetical protein V6N12_046473 [Hibiscus sabdariffa]|uniref:Leucine-rich repeat-containing N-terminal plant-type domain-containing protein n=1 Tax=Hibiscus sabdariffa TaxID=183260 RepID=A0ABR2DIR5_9ROSI